MDQNSSTVCQYGFPLHYAKRHGNIFIYFGNTLFAHVDRRLYLTNGTCTACQQRVLTRTNGGNSPAVNGVRTRRVMSKKLRGQETAVVYTYELQSVENLMPLACLLHGAQFTRLLPRREAVCLPLRVSHSSVFPYIPFQLCTQVWCQ